MTFPVRRTLAAALTAACLLTSCAQDGDKPDETATTTVVTTDQAERLAVMRFNNFRLGTRTVTAQLTTQGMEVRLTGAIDYANAVGYVAVKPVDSATFASDLAIWSHDNLLVKTGVPLAEDQGFPVPPPGGRELAGWERGPLDARSSVLHTVLATLLAVGADRPDNPLLIQQGGARFLRDDVVGDLAVAVYSGPQARAQAAATATAPESNLRYWIDETATLRRLEVRTPEGQWLQIDLGEETDLDLAPYKKAVQS